MNRVEERMKGPLYEVTLAYLRGEIDVDQLFERSMKINSLVWLRKLDQLIDSGRSYYGERRDDE